MEAFLEKIAGSVTKENLPYLYTRCYIFPTKRAAIHFTRFLKEKHAGENFILPETITIQEFITAYSSYIIRDDWHLLLELYRIQNELTGTEQPLEKFLPWGKLILKDFDECDKYLVNVQELFSILKAQKEMDETFSISEETRKYIEQFILTTTSGETEKSAQYKTAFIKTWSLLGDMYRAFQDKLRAANFAYEGMAYREVYEHLAAKSLLLPYSKVTFCGFNALSVCEEKIFKCIEAGYDTEFWWDADEHFMNNPLHEAGNFLRRYQQVFSGENNHWIIDSDLAGHKTIDIAGISSDVGQTEYVAQHLADAGSGTTAIVLCNEHLLQPLLYTLDSSTFNITMGYSISESELYLYTISLLNLYCHARITDSSTDYYHKEIAALARHVYAPVKNKQKLDKILPYFIPYMPKEIAEEFFQPQFLLEGNSSVTTLKNILQHICQAEDQDVYFHPVREKIMERLLFLMHSLEQHHTILDRNALPFIVRQFLSAEKVPFETSTDNNIQIMGFLETRILDYDNLFILSLNDDNLPGTNKTNSFIPYNLRKGFGLPTFEQFDGINAYHFYRLLKRAGNIHLLYNNQIGDNSSEKSRFIRQIQHELQTPENAIREFIATMEDTGADITSDSTRLQIKKTDRMIADLRVRKFSPSALKVYLQCPVQFYLKYVEGIAEPEELTEEIDAAVFGQILHKALEIVYRTHLNNPLTADMIKGFSSAGNVHDTIRQACTELELPKEILQGSNKLQLTIIERIARKILLNDADLGQLHILQTENKFIWEKLALEDGTFATIQGTIDRVDKFNEQAVRIMDYKTGHIDLPDFPDLNNETEVQVFMDKLFIFGKKDHSAAFQGLLYALIYHKLHDCKEIYVGYHHAKSMKSGITYLNEQQPVPMEILYHFEQRLSQLVSEIVYKEACFTQTENTQAYQYSPYADLLGVN